ncbi:hypothetical protein H4R18_002496 [Coemansia javaensis]|uniref:Uncharacterized protein n=1 Tax=Coemansia javaensis TaxID=2761396 RepID=A0A9W8HEX3_9FUNG|nr:hypothetical protein H4R18_002496 [Coemansia javaensis]
MIPLSAAEVPAHSGVRPGCIDPPAMRMGTAPRVPSTLCRTVDVADAADDTDSGSECGSEKAGREAAGPGPVPPAGFQPRPRPYSTSAVPDRSYRLSIVTTNQEYTELSYRKKTEVVVRPSRLRGWLLRFCGNVKYSIGQIVASPSLLVEGNRDIACGNARINFSRQRRALALLESEAPGGAKLSRKRGPSAKSANNARYDIAQLFCTPAPTRPASEYRRPASLLPPRLQPLPPLTNCAPVDHAPGHMLGLGLGLGLELDARPYIPADAILSGAAGFGQGTLDDAAQDTTDDATQDTVGDAAQDNATSDFNQEVIDGSSQEATQGGNQEAIEDDSQEAIQDDSHETIQDDSQEAIQDDSYETTEDDSQDVEAKPVASSDNNSDDSSVASRQSEASTHAHPAAAAAAGCTAVEAAA